MSLQIRFFDNTSSFTIYNIFIEHFTKIEIKKGNGRMNAINHAHSPNKIKNLHVEVDCQNITEHIQYSRFPNILYLNLITSRK